MLLSDSRPDVHGPAVLAKALPNLLHPPLDSLPRRLASTRTSLTPILASLWLVHPLARLEAESHAIRSRQSRAIQSDSQTGGTYARHLACYQVW